MVERKDNKESINYAELYKDNSVKCSYKDDAGYEKLCTGKIVFEDLLNIVIDTPFHERILIRKELVGNIRAKLKGGIDNATQRSDIKD